MLEVITNLSETRVFQVKNGYIDKENKDNGYLVKSDQYADIKVILIVGSGDDYEYEELVEIQIIQRVNLELKKLDHKL